MANGQEMTLGEFLARIDQLRYLLDVSDPTLHIPVLGTDKLVAGIIVSYGRQGVYELQIDTTRRE